jgi:hypothetical protein
MDHHNRRMQSAAGDLIVPTMPNRPLASPRDIDPMGRMQLRQNLTSGFIENEAFDPGLLIYDDRYQNSLAFSPRFNAHLVEVASLLRSRFPQGSRVVEVGCGKGDFFNVLAEGDYFSCRGFDAAYEGQDPRIERRFLSSDDRISCDLVVLRHTLEHIQAPHRFLAFLAEVFGDVPIYIEVPDVDWTLKNKAFVDITYEHVNYFTRAALVGLFDRESSPLSGPTFDDQYQFVIGRLGDLAAGFATSYASDAWRGLGFGDMFPAMEDLITKIDQRLGGERKAYIWGAATKGCMFLAHCARLGKVIDQVAFAVDANPGKVGGFLPFSHVCIRSPAQFIAEAEIAGLLIVANPAYVDEIRRSLAATPLASVEIIAL